MAVSRFKVRRDYIKQMVLINEDDVDEQIPLDEMFYKTVSNPAVRRCELMVRMRGFEEIAKRMDYAAEFYTLTAPSAYHAVHSQGGFISHWNFSSPKDTQAYLCKQFAKIRASLARKNIKPFGFRVVEPHHDGTPHWHLLLFMPKVAVQTVRDTFRRYALEVDGNEQGANEHRFKFEPIDWEKGSATGYIAKYVAKNIDGYACDEDKDMETGESLKNMSKNVSAWAAKWRIRQFQQLGGSPVTVWRELRRQAGKAVEGDELLTQLVEAADRGDWAEYCLLQGQGKPTVKREELQARTLYEDRAPNQYGEVSKKIIGFYHQQLEKVRKVLTRTKNYKLVKKSVLGLNGGNTDERSESTHCVRSTPWSSVNNCTVRKIDNVKAVLDFHADELELLKTILEIKQVPRRWITDHRLARLLRGDYIEIMGGVKLRWNGYDVNFVKH